MKKLFVGLVGLAALAAAGASFSYQGVLRDATGGAVAEKNQTITFRLYDGPGDGATALWGRSSSVHLDDSGLFNVELGDSTGSAVEGLTATLEEVLSEHGNALLYIGLEVSNSSGEIRPRQKLLAVPVSSFAQDVSLARRDFTVTGKATLNGSLSVKGETTLEGKVVARSLSVASDATFAGTTKMTGSLNLSGGSLEMPKGASITIDGVSAVIPSGVIVMWSGSSGDIPAGWALCNGRNGTPDLQDRFIVGAGRSYSVNATGGAASVALTVAQLPSHTHRVDARAGDLAAAWKNNSYFFDFSRHYSGNDRSFDTEATGGNESHENRPPYYALCFIMKK